MGSTAEQEPVELSCGFRISGTHVEVLVAQVAQLPLVVHPSYKAGVVGEHDFDTRSLPDLGDAASGSAFEGRP